MALPACNVRQIYERGGMLASPLLGTVASLYCLPSRTWLDMRAVQKRNFWLQILPKVEMSLHKWCVAHSCAAFVRIGIYAPAIMRPTKFALKYTKQPCSMFRVWAFSRARLVWFSVFLTMKIFPLKTILTNIWNNLNGRPLKLLKSRKCSSCSEQNSFRHFAFCTKSVSFVV